MSKLILPRGYSKQHTERRRKWLVEKTGFYLNNTPPDEPEKLKGIIENHVGFMQVPMAVAGPLKISGTYAHGEYYIPLCTLEGTLCMSMTRGLYLTYLSNGIKTTHIKQELSRSPMFAFKEIHETPVFTKWINKNFKQIKKAAESTTNHGKLLRIETHIIQDSVVLDFIYNTAEAAGQNMVTIATFEACKFIKEKYQAEQLIRYYIECNFSCDKNPAYKTILQGRSHHIVASALIKSKPFKRLLHCTPEDYVEAWSKCSRGSRLAGVVGNNMHVANALAAIYLATGQDMACVAENAVGTVEFELRNKDDLYATLTMPSISVGTVGGGTRLKQQKSNLEMLRCSGKNSSKKLAEIVCACALALELSLGGAIVSDEFAQSHAEYGRG
ncbi:hydroxymethylglutaryl-CoA reductase [candidate division KSB1 bacterium]|nr:hydroxymethylglutaryl-CoA reductase [candidate division KSB1 bacterium]